MECCRVRIPARWDVSFIGSLTGKALTPFNLIIRIASFNATYDWKVGFRSEQKESDYDEVHESL
jgi:hypothetical protein